jgi:hypothetical protein
MAESRRAVLASLTIAGLALIGSFFVPEVRRFFGLERNNPPPSQAGTEMPSAPVAHAPEAKTNVQRGSVPIAEGTAGQGHSPLRVDTGINGSSGVTPATGRPIDSASRQTFETESYRLTAEDLKKFGKTVRVTMVLEAIDEGGLTFRAGEWYLLDENGERWTQLRPDPALIRQQRREGLQPPLTSVHLVSGTKVKDKLIFNAMGSGQGTNFTLIGLESSPQPRREIVLRGLIGNGD